MAEAPASLPAHEGEPAGVYLYEAGAGSWWWSEEVDAIQGLTPGTSVPTMELLLRHTHPDDRDHVRDVLEGCLADGHPFSCYHRVVDARGTLRRVVVAGDGRLDQDGKVLAIRGFLIDLTGPINQDIRDTSDATISAARESQASIDQARGIIMAVYGVDADAAFTILRRHSQHTNTKLRDLARAMVEAAPAPPGSGRNELRRRLERALYPGSTA